MKVKFFQNAGVKIFIKWLGHNKVLRDSRAQKSQKLPTYLLPLQLSTVEHSSLGKRKTDLYIGTSPSTLLFLKVNFILPGFLFVVHLFRGFYGGFQTL